MARLIKEKESAQISSRYGKADEKYRGYFAQLYTKNLENFGKADTLLENTTY